MLAIDHLNEDQLRWGLGALGIAYTCMGRAGWAEGTVSPSTTRGRCHTTYFSPQRLTGASKIGRELVGPSLCFASRD